MAAKATKSELTRLRILDAAAYVLGQNGYAGTKLADVAKRADIQSSTLYYYFESREELVLAVLLAGSERVRLHMQDVLANAPKTITPLERVCLAVEAHLRYILEISQYTEAAIRNAGSLPKKLEAQVAEEQKRYMRFWQNLIDPAVAGTGKYEKPSERRALRLLVIGALNWTVNWWRPERTSIDDIVETALTMVRGALAPK